MIYKFYDTCSLLLKANHLWDEDCHIVLSSITLEELEHIKTSINKDPDVKFAARKLIKELDEHYGEYSVVFWNNELMLELTDKSLPITNDSKIIICALNWFNNLQPGDQMTFITNDICCKQIAHLVLQCDIESIAEDAYNYDGYKEIVMDDDEMAEFYSNPTKNIYELYINEYIIVKDKEGNIVDKLCWTGDRYRHLTYNSFKSD